MKHAAGMVLLAAAVIATAMWRARVAEDPAPAGRVRERQRIQRFWEVFHDAQALRLRGEYERAAERYRESAGMDSKHEDSLYYLGISLEESGDYVAAAAAYRRLALLNPQSARAWSQLGSLLSSRAPGAPVDFDEASRALRRTVEINREQAGPFLRLGWLELNRWRPAAALAHFRIAAGFGSPEGMFWTGYAQLLLGRRAQAEAAFRKVLESAARERGLAGRGIRAEGDILPDPAKPLSAMERAVVKSMLLSHGTLPRLTMYQPPRPQLPPGILIAGTVTSVAAADFDRDGRDDLFAVAWRKPVRLYRNLGGGRYADATGTSGLGGIRAQSFSAAVIDYDRDGAPDIFLSAHAPWEDSARSLLQPHFQPVRHTPRLFRNRGDGTFEQVAGRLGLRRCWGTVRAVATDQDGDGWPDLLLYNGSPDAWRLEPNFLLHNAGGTGFEVSSLSVR
ncbi:MAG: VCBS repeat-containing protein [Acidobacteria bacterium]|nr:VCBS repeat-containing protein [Acidobacteriota bacterium]